MLIKYVCLHDIRLCREKKGIWLQPHLKCGKMNELSPLPTMVRCVPPLMLPLRGHMNFTSWASEIKIYIWLKSYTIMTTVRLCLRSCLYNTTVAFSSYCSKEWGGGGGGGPPSAAGAPARMGPAFPASESAVFSRISAVLQTRLL